MQKFAFTKGRLIGLICSSIIPIAAIGLGILMLIKDVMLDLGIAITYLIFPLIVIALLGLCIFYNFKTWKKVVLSVVILVLFAMVFQFFCLIAGWTQVKSYEGDEAVQKYSSLKSEMLPKLSEVGETTNTEYHNVFSFIYIFSYETNYLICQYEQEEYENQKNRLDSTYIFQTETITDYDSNCEPMVKIGDYQFKMLSVENYDLYYPKHVVLIGYSDNAREIVYLEFYDIDLDYIPSLKDFIIDEFGCGWKYIR